MPRQDGTGPTGQGPMTGRGMGPCAGGMGYSRRACGFGYRRFISPKNELKALENEKAMMEEELEALREEIETLKKGQ